MREKWLIFIYPALEAENRPGRNVLVCSAHFTADCSINLAQLNAGFASRLLLKDTAVPTLLGPSSQTQQPVSKLSFYFDSSMMRYNPQIPFVGNKVSEGTALTKTLHSSLNK